MDQASQKNRPAGLIAVMGATGTGKSSFINAITGQKTSDVGHSLESQTSTINEYDFQLPNGLVVTLVDTPGFNDYTSDGGGKSDLVILKEIGEFLKKKYDEKRKFSGILYLHNICEPKIGSSLQRQMAMFKKLCGDDPLKNVVVITTFWDGTESLEGGIQTETELKTKDKFFKGLVDGGSKFVRHGLYSQEEQPKDPKFQQPLSIVIDLLSLDPVFVEMQKELAQGKAVEETSAAVELYRELQELKRQQKRDVSELNMKIEDMKLANARDRELRETLEEKQRNLTAEMAQNNSDLQNTMATWKKQIEADAKRHSLELEAIRRNEFKGDLDLLKIMHEKEIMECRFQIRSLMDGDSTADYRRDHLEKTTEDLKAVVCSLSLALEKSRETHEKEVVERLQFMGEFKKLRASAERWADEEKRLSRGWEEARSALERVKSELTCALSKHEQVTAELKDSQKTVVMVNSQLKDVHATKEKLLEDLEEARSKVTQLNKELAASRKSQEGLASKLSGQSHVDVELENVTSELASCKRQNVQMESQLSKTKSELAAASSNSSLLQKAESDLALAKADLLVARKQLSQGKHILPLLDASPNLKLPVNSVPLSFPIQPYRFIKNVVVKSFTGTALEDGYVTEMGGHSANINNGFGGEAVYLYPRYTFDNREAISKFSLRLQDESDKSKTDLAKGCPKPFRYLDSDRNPNFANITAISLLRSSSSQSVPEGWDGMFDLNKSRGSEFLYLVWRRMPTSVTTILPHRFVKDIVVEFFSTKEAVKPGYLEEKSNLSSDINEGFGGDYRVYLYPKYTLLYDEAISGLSLILKDNRDSSKTDLAIGAPGKFRYLDIERDSDIDATKICNVMLLRSKQRAGLPEGWDGDRKSVV